MKTIIFDFDGVIEDNYELHYELSQKQIRNITREEHRKLFEGNIHAEREKLKDRHTGFDLVTEFSKSKKGVKIKLEIKKTLTELSKKYILGIITSGKEEGIYDYLETNDIEDLFSFVYGFETSKSKVEKFRKVFEEFNVLNNECVMITDTLGDILEANHLGIKSIAVDFGFHEKERLAKGNPIAIISKFSDLVNIINNIQ